MPHKILLFLRGAPTCQGRCTGSGTIIQSYTKDSTERLQVPRTNISHLRNAPPALLHSRGASSSVTDAPAAGTGATGGYAGDNHGGDQREPRMRGQGRRVCACIATDGGARSPAENQGGKYQGGHAGLDGGDGRRSLDGEHRHRPQFWQGTLWPGSHGGAHTGCKQIGYKKMPCQISFSMEPHTEGKSMKKMCWNATGVKLFSQLVP